MNKLPNITIVESGMRVKVDLSRLNGNLAKAQFWLDTQIMRDMEPYMPHNDGILQSITAAQSATYAGSGLVVAAAPPYGRFQYMGKVMVDPETGSPFARPGAKKIVTERPLTYSNPRATPKWFETAKENHGDEWIREVKRIAGGK